MGERALQEQPLEILTLKVGWDGVKKVVPLYMFQGGLDRRQEEASTA